MVVAPVVIVSFVVVEVLVNVVVVIHRSRLCVYVVVVVEASMSVPVKGEAVGNPFELLRRESGRSE